jgi:hypothetical protein
MAKIHQEPASDSLLVDVAEACRQLGIHGTKFYEIPPDFKGIVIGRKRLIFPNSMRDYAAYAQRASRL